MANLMPDESLPPNGPHRAKDGPESDRIAKTGRDSSRGERTAAAGSTQERTADQDESVFSAVTYVGPEGGTRVEAGPIGHLPAAFGNYELICEIGRGGMGVTYRARQISLNRLVALKMIKSGLLADEQEVRRFQTEAEAAAALDHPNIVPVYEVGHLAGHHFYSMGLVEGPSLEHYLRAGPLSPHDAAKLMLAIAVAMAHAHAADVIHRDLKPSNILLSQTTLDPGNRARSNSTGAPSSSDVAVMGAPRITDFGLAKRLSVDSDLTLTGQVVGTPAYMPPEQAEGHGDAIDARSDVYAMGAVLYHAICGRPPFLAAGTMKTLRQVIESEPVHPRQLNETIDKDLETICLKCLAKEPQHRYQSAQLLADDLRSYLDQRPIQARPVGTVGKFARWCRRRPALAATSIGLIAVLVVGSIVSTFFAIQAQANAEFYRQEKDRADQEAALAVRALGREQEAHAKLRASLNETERTIQRWVDTACNTKLLQEPRFKPVLKSMLQEARDHYAAFVAQHADDAAPADQLRLAAAFYRIGKISEQSGSISDALGAYDKAITLYSTVLPVDTGDKDSQLRHAMAVYNRAQILSQIGQPAKAIHEFESVIARLERLASHFPMDQQIGKTLAMAYGACGTVAADNGDADRGLQLRLRASKTMERLYQAAPDNGDYGSTLAMSYQNLGMSLAAMSKIDEAIAKFDQAQSILQQLTANDPANADYLQQLGLLHRSIGASLWEAGDIEGALVKIREQQRVFDQLVRRHPTVTEYTYHLATSYDAIGSMEITRGRSEAALVAFDHARQLLAQLTTEYPTKVAFKSDYGGVFFNVGNLYDDTGRPAEALEAYQRAADIHRELVSANPKTTAFQCDLARSLSCMGIVLAELDRGSDALVAYREAIEISERVVHDNPQVTWYKIHLAGNYVNITTLDASTASDNRNYLGRAIELLKDVLKQDDSLVVARQYLRNAAWRSAELWEASRSFSEAAADWQLAAGMATGWWRSQFATRELIARWRAEDPNWAPRSLAVISSESLRWLKAMNDATRAAKETPADVSKGE